MRQLRDVMKALAENPILEGSGEYEMVEASRRSIADMVNDMAQELIQLENHVAYVKRGASGEESVKIQTVPLAPGCSMEELVSRKIVIAQNTLPYTTNREEVEKELQERHAQYTTGKKPQPQTQAQERTKETTQEPQPEKEETQRVTSASSQGTQHAVVTASQPATPDYLTLLYFFSNATLSQLVKLVGLIGQTRDEQLKINKREQSKINKLIGSGLVETVEPEQTTFLKTGGRAPLVYRLTKKGYDTLQKEKGLKPINAVGFSPHAYKVNEVLITFMQGLKETSAMLVDFSHEKQFRQKPISLGEKGLEPDSWLCLRVNGHLHSVYVEIDRKTEGSSNLKDKIRRYVQALETKAHKGFTAEHVSVAFITPNSKEPEKDTDRLVRIIKEALEEDGKPEYAKHFLVASLTLEDIAPVELLTGSLFKKPYGTATMMNEEWFGTDSVPDVPQHQVTPASPVPALDKNLKKLSEQFLRHEKRLLYEMAGHYDGTPIDDPDLEKPIQERIEEIKTDPYALKEFLRKNKGGCNKFANPKDGKDACYLARSTFAVRAAQRVLGEPLLPWTPLMQQLLAQVTHPDLQRVIQEDRDLS